MLIAMKLLFKEIVIMKKFINVFLMVTLLSIGSLNAQAKEVATDLPDISVIGNFLGKKTDKKKSFTVQEIEFAFQHYLYPTVRSDIFVGLHKEENGTRKIELEEGYVTFSDLMGVLMPNQNIKLGLGAKVGKKLVGIGRINPLHPGQWQFTDRPIAVTQFLGEHGLAAEGGELSYLLPLPFFS